MEESFSDHEEDDDDIRFVKYLSLGFSEEQARNMVEKNKPHTKVVKKTTSNMSQLVTIIFYLFSKLLYLISCFYF